MNKKKEYYGFLREVGVNRVFVHKTFVVTS